MSQEKEGADGYSGGHAGHYRSVSRLAQRQVGLYFCETQRLSNAMKSVIEMMRRRSPISEATAALLERSVEPMSFSRREVMVAEGKQARHAFFLRSGMTRSYWIVDGEEVTTSFSEAGAIVFSMDEVYYGLASQEYVQALEDVEVYAIKVEKLRALVSENIELSRWWGKIHEDEYRRLHRSHRDRLTLDAGERYRAFCDQFPEVACRAPLGCIASYLGITGSTLSRLRRKSLLKNSL